MINQETEIDIPQMNKTQILDFEDFSREMVGEILIESVKFFKSNI
jgi:hypothetical protein